MDTAEVAAEAVLNSLACNQKAVLAGGEHIRVLTARRSDEHTHNLWSSAALRLSKVVDNSEVQCVAVSAVAMDAVPYSLGDSRVPNSPLLRVRAHEAGFVGAVDRKASAAVTSSAPLSLFLDPKHEGAVECGFWQPSSESTENNEAVWSSEGLLREDHFANGTVKCVWAHTTDFALVSKQGSGSSAPFGLIALFASVAMVALVAGLSLTKKKSSKAATPYSPVNESPIIIAETTHVSAYHSINSPEI